MTLQVILLAIVFFEISILNFEHTFINHFCAYLGKMFSKQNGRVAFETYRIGINIG